MANLIDMVIRAQNKASPEIQKIQKDLGNLEKETSKTGMSIANFGTKAAAAFGISLGVAGVVKMTQAIADLAIESGKVQQLRASFEGLAVGVGQSSDAMLEAMRRASDGLVTDADLILSANKAMLLGVADTGEELSALLEVARARGAAMGLTTTQAFNDIVTGLGRESALILDNLGITIDLEGVMQDYAASLGLTAAQLDAAQRKQALLNEVMRQSAGMVAPIDTAATAWQKASVAIDNAKESLGELFGPAVAAALNMVAAGADELNKAITVTKDEAATSQYLGTLEQIRALQERLQESNASLKGTYDEIDAANRELAASGVQLGATTENTTEAIKAEIAALQQQATALYGTVAATAQTKDEAWNAVASFGAFRASVVDAQAAADAAQAELYQTAAGLGEVGRMALAASTDINSFNAALNRIQGAKPMLDSIAAMRQGAASQIQSLGMQAIGAGADSGQVAAMVATLTDQVMNLGLSYEMTTEAQFANRLAVEGTLQPLQNLVDETNAANTATAKLAKDGAKAATDEFDSLAGKVSSVVSGLLSIGDISIDSGPRQDAANENARRLAAIANEGLIDQSWLAEFKNEVPAIFDEIVSSADPQGAAKRLYEEFQAGMHPELLDREMVKSNIRRMIVGEETMNAYVTEIAQELATEMNVSFPAAYKAAIGEGGGGFADGFTEGTDALKATLAGEAATFKDSGTAILESFQTGIDAQWATFLEYWKGKMQQLRNQLPFSEPKDPTSPLRGLGKSGRSMVRMIQDGIDRESFNVNVLGGRAQAASTTTNNTMPVSITVNVSGGADGGAISAAVQNGVLSAARSMGIR